MTDSSRRTVLTTGAAVAAATAAPLVLPDDVPAHPLVVSIAIASLAPNAEITVFPWKDEPELKARTINRARTFLKRHVPA